MKIKYVGLKEDGETAFSAITGITWFPGSSEDVPNPIAVKMLQHPDVFARDEETVGTGTTAPASLSLSAAIPAGTIPTAPLPLGDVDTLLGSDILPAHIDIGGEKVSLGSVVAAAFKRSDISLGEWNELPSADREQRLTDEIAALTEALKTPAVLIQLDSGIVDLTGYTREALYKLATDNGLTPHHQTGPAKLITALQTAFPVK